MLQLRDYQKDICNKAIQSMRSYKRTLITLPTGSGKTIVAAHLINYLNNKGLRGFYIVNREELVNQSNAKFHDFRSDVSIIKAGTKYKHLYKPEKPIQIIMIQTFFARLKKLPDLKPDYIIFDEAHEGFSGSRVKAILEAYPNAIILGKTATPCDSQGWLLEGFDNYIQDLQLSDIQNLGYLVEDRVFIPVNLELDDVKITGDDYNEHELSVICSESELITNVVDNFKAHASNLQTLVFSVDIYHAEKLTEEFKKAGYKAEVIHSKLDDPKKRDEIIKKFNNKEIQIIVNVAVLTTGFDSTGIQCVVFARPSKVLRLVLQMAGRGLRTDPIKCPTCGNISFTSFINCEHCNSIIADKKTDCLFLDCANIYTTFGFPSDNRYYKHKPPKELRMKKKKQLLEETKVLICLKCKYGNKPNRKYCAECGEPLHAPLVNIVNEADLKEVIKPAIGWEEINTILKIRCMQYKTEPHEARVIFRKIKELMPPGYNEQTYKKRVLTRLRQSARDNKNPFWVVYDLAKFLGVKSA